MPKTNTTTKPKGKKKGKTRAEIRDKAVLRGVKILENWWQFAKPRLDTIREMELSYYGQVRPNLKGRSNFPFPVLAKYIDAIKARLDDLPIPKLENDRRAAQYNVLRQAEAAINRLKKPTNGDWARHDRIGRINSLFAGYCAMEFFTDIDRTGKFVGHAKAIDHNDFVFEPLAGSDLEEHKAVGKYPIFRTEEDLHLGVEEGIYEGKQVERLLARMGDERFKKNGENLMARFQRYKALGLDVENNSYVGEKVCALAELQIEHSGKRWLMTFDPQTQIAIRFQPLEEVFSSGLYSIVLYQTHEDGNVVMCKSPADDIYPVAEGMRVKVNQTFDASTKALWGQRVFDPRFFPDPSELEWRRPDQLIAGKLPDGFNSFAEGLYKIDNTFDFGSNLDFLKWLDDFLTSLTGVNPNDLSEETKKVGTLYGQLAKTGAMMNIQNKSYSDMWAKGVIRILWGMHDNLTESMTVKIIGSAGAEWAEFSNKELGDPNEYDVSIQGSTVEAEMNAAKNDLKQKVLTAIAGNPYLIKEMNLRALNEELLELADIPMERITRLMDTKNYGKEKMISRADMAIEQILEGKEPKVYQGADLTFYEYILDFANDMDDSGTKNAEQRVAILKYGQSHKSIVIKNTARQTAEDAAMKKAAAAMAALENPPDKTAPPNDPNAQKPVMPQKTGNAPMPSNGVIPAHLPIKNRKAGLPPPLPPMAGGGAAPAPVAIPANPSIPQV